KAHVLREGGIVAIPSRELVPGDVTVLAAGDRVAADARLLEAAGLRLNEASLTGESQPVVKAIEPLPRDSFVGDRKNMVFMGTADTSSSCFSRRSASRSLRSRKASLPSSRSASRWACNA